tara:strand:+ start:206 stop:412 length:207 start_codon:yes stop_codon:yes gene_type:complete
MRKTIQKHSGVKKYRDKWIRCIEHGKYRQYNKRINSPLCQKCTKFWGNTKYIGKNNIKDTLKSIHPVI